MMKMCRVGRAHRLALFVMLVTVQAGLTQQLTLTPLKATGIYAVGEKVGWEVRVRDPNAAPVTEASYTLKRNGLTTYREGTHVYGQLAKPKGEGKCPSLISMGFIDETCPPTGVWSAVNQIKVPKEVLPLINSPHNDMPPGVQRPHQIRREEWLAALAKGENPIK